MRVSLFVTCLADQLRPTAGAGGASGLAGVEWASFSGRLTWHAACHGLRDLGIKDEPRRLLRRVTGAELVELPNAEACCGFGGTFSVKYPEISVAILDEKVDAIERAGVDAVVSGDVSCLMQIAGRLSRRGSTVRALHLAEVLASTP